MTQRGHLKLVDDGHTRAMTQAGDLAEILLMAARAVESDQPTPTGFMSVDQERYKADVARVRSFAAMLDRAYPGMIFQTARDWEEVHDVNGYAALLEAAADLDVEWPS